MTDDTTGGAQLPLDLRTEEERTIEDHMSNIASLKAQIAYEEECHERRIGPLVRMLKNTEQSLKDICPHKNAETKEQYFDGSYLDRASTTRWLVCPTCGWESDKVNKTHSWYG